tara:strand:+ start:472 stop:1521 length:1050 start_codon:yes stop_codon:yes gene_type:complete
MTTDSDNSQDPSMPTPYDPWDTSNDRVLIAYHDNCLDGFTAAWAAYRGMSQLMCKPELLPMSYNPESTQKLFDALTTGDSVLGIQVVDFSLPVDVLARLQCCHPSVFVNILDHHKTAFEAYCPDIDTIECDTVVAGKLHGCNYILDNSESGASLTYKHFNYQGVPEEQTLPLPLLIQYVKDYDLWQFNLGDKTRWVNKYLMLQDRTLQRWDELLEMFDNECSYSAILDAGRELEEAHMLMVTKIARTAKPFSIYGEEGLFCMCPYELMSDVGHELANKSGTYGIMVVIDEKKVVGKWSLRSNGDYDVSKLAGFFGGGGHKNAAGFETSINESLQMMRDDGTGRLRGEEG